MSVEEENKNGSTIKISSENAANDLIKLVLALTNTIRELMEKQALRKIENDELSADKVEELGTTFLALEEKMKELRDQFGFTDQDLEIDLKQFITFQ